MKKIVGYENEKKEILCLQKMLLNAEAYRASGVRLPKGLVLFGDPGVGKTQLAKSILTKGIKLVEICASSLSDEDALESIDRVFDFAEKNQPSVILLDEIDKFAGLSDRYYMEENSNIQKYLLKKLDNIDDDDTVLVIATCNNKMALGDALLRAGRFDRQIEVELPDDETRAKIYYEYFRRLKIKKDLDYNYLSRITPGYSGARIECLVNEVGIFAIENDLEMITVEDVRVIINRLAFSGIEKKPVRDKNKLRIIATHEAGHAMVAMFLLPDALIGASVLPQGDSNGHIHFVNPDDGVTSVGDLEKEIAVLLAGHVAEREVLGKYYIGSGDDLAGAEARIRYLTINQAAYGYEPIIGTTAYRYDMINDCETKSIARGIMANKLSVLDDRAATIIRENRALFDNLVKELMEKQTLSGDDLLRIKSESGVGKIVQTITSEQLQDCA